MKRLFTARFDAILFEWRGPAPFVFASVPDALVGEIRFVSRSVSYGWGVVPVRACNGESEFNTSLFPRDGGYLVPIKVVVQRAELIGPGASVSLEMWIEDPAQPQ